VLRCAGEGAELAVDPKVVTYCGGAVITFAADATAATTFALDVRPAGGPVASGALKFGCTTKERPGLLAVALTGPRADAACAKPDLKYGADGL